VYGCVYFLEIELNIVLQAVLYLHNSDLQYSLCTVLLRVPLAALKTKLLTELLAVPNLTLPNQKQLLMTLLALSADSVLCCFVKRYSSAKWNRKLFANCQSLSAQLTLLLHVRTEQQLQ
jgi:hypothetical protein